MSRFHASFEIELILPSYLADTEDDQISIQANRFKIPSQLFLQRHRQPENGLANWKTCLRCRDWNYVF